MGYGAENVSGLKGTTEAMDVRLLREVHVVGERSVCSEAEARATVERTEVRMLG